MQLVFIDHQYLLPLQESSTSIFLLIHTKPNHSFLQRFAAGWTHGEANPQGSDTHSLQPPLLKQWTLGNLHFISFQGKFRGYSVVLSHVFSMSFFDTEIWDRYFFFTCSSSCLNWLILLATARIKHVFAIEDALSPAVSEAKQVIGYAHRLWTFFEQWL